MGYQVRKRYVKANGSVVWRVIFEQWSGEEREIFRHVPKKEYAALGFFDTMTFDQAKEHAKHLSSRDQKLKIEARRNKINTRIREQEKITAAFFPESVCAAFESDVLLDTVCWGEKTRNYTQLLSYWRAGRVMMVELNLSPDLWCESRNRLYAYVRDKSWSLSYANKILRVLNLYGKLYARTTKTFFEEVPKSTREAAVRINEKFFRRKPHGHVSSPITWEKLKGLQDKFKPERWNWVYLSLWFGLRPSELENLQWKIEESSGQKLLAVFQNKLYRLPPDQRWKFIPILFPEQEVGLEMIRTESFQKPLVKTLQKHFGNQVSLRAGRKGFVALMWEQGGYAKDIAFRWLGHKSVKTTDMHYTQSMQLALAFERKKKAS